MQREDLAIVHDVDVLVKELNERLKEAALAGLKCHVEPRVTEQRPMGFHQLVSVAISRQLLGDPPPPKSR